MLTKKKIWDKGDKLETIENGEMRKQAAGYASQKKYSIANY